MPERFRDIRQGPQFSSPVERSLQIPPEHINIAFYADGPSPSVALGEISKDAHRFAQRVSLNIGGHMLHWMHQESQKPYSLHPRIHHEVKTNGLYMPRFDFYEQEAAGAFLADIAMPDEHIDADSLLMVYKLPKPVAHLWWLMGGFIDDKTPMVTKGAKKAIGYDTEIVQEQMQEGNFVPLPPWGDAYFGSRHIFWDEVEGRNTPHKLHFDRILERGDHDPQKYYYIFEVSRAVQSLEKPRPITVFQFPQKSSA